MECKHNKKRKKKGMIEDENEIKAKGGEKRRQTKQNVKENKNNIMIRDTETYQLNFAGKPFTLRSSVPATLSAGVWLAEARKQCAPTLPTGDLSLRPRVVDA